MIETIIFFVGIMYYIGNKRGFMKYDAIVLAGGKGTRLDLGYNKVFYKMDNGKTVLENALKPFLRDKECQNVIIAVSSEDKKMIKVHPKMVFVENGEERFFSVYNALLRVKAPYVMIHDGARPYITSDDIKNLKSTLETEDTCMLGKKAKDTIKVVNDGYIVKTLDRNTIYMAQTPQCFKTDEIIKAYEMGYRSKGTFTDDASVYEVYYHKPIRMVDSVNSNNKITFIEDLK